MGQKTKIFSENVLLLRKIQKTSLLKEKNKIKKWVEQLQCDSFLNTINKQSLQEEESLEIESKEILNQVAKNILQDIIKK